MSESREQIGEVEAYHLVLFQGRDDRDLLGSLDRHVVRLISHKLGEKVASPPERTEINLWIDSPGGDAHAVYKLFLDIRSRCTRYRAIVPDYAKSAATLLVLGADEIMMDAAAELGPLDAQVEHPDREGKIVSALDAARALNHLAELARDLTLAAGPQIIYLTELPRTDVLRELLRFMARFFEPAVAKLDPQLIHQATNDLRVAQEYAKRMLEARNQPGKGTNGLDAEELSAHLVSKYPAHGFVISRTEARELGLPIFNAVNHPRWGKIKSLHTAFLKRCESIIEVLRDSDLDQREERHDKNQEVECAANECRGPQADRSAPGSDASEASN